MHSAVIERRQVERLRVEQVGPYADPIVAELARGGLHDEDTVAIVAVAAALSAAGMPLPSAMRVVMAFLDTLPNHAPARFCNIEGRPSRGEWLPTFAAATMEIPDLVRLSQALDGDALLIVVDGSLISEGIRNPRILPVPIPGVDMSKPVPIGRIENSDLPDRSIFTALADSLDYSDTDAVCAAYRSFHYRMDHSRTVVSINMSFAIRIAFMLICERRKESGHDLPTINRGAV